MDEFIFHFSAASVLPFWFMMIILPRHPLTEKMVRPVYMVVPAALCYLYFLLPNLADGLAAFQNPGLHELTVLSGQAWGAGMFWAYAGAFDLFVGRWIFFDARNYTLPRTLIGTILFICILFGPLAFLIYLGLRATRPAMQQKD